MPNLSLSNDTTLGQIKSGPGGPFKIIKYSILKMVLHLQVFKMFLVYVLQQYVPVNLSRLILPYYKETLSFNYCP